MPVFRIHRHVFVFLFISGMLLVSSCNRNFFRFFSSDTRYQLTTETQLLDTTHSREIDKFYDSGEEGTFEGKRNISIYYKKFEHPDTEKAIVISSGRTEAAIKYKEVIYDLYRNGYSVYIHDHRGQGQSGRMTDDPQMGYVKAFQAYIDDMKMFYNDHVAPRNYDHTYLLAHSMGGAIGMTYLEQFPEDFDAAAFSSPMLGLKAPICSAAKVLVGEKPKYAVGQTAYKEDSLSFKNNALTGSKVRYDRMIAAYAEVPEARLGGATYRWLRESCKQFQYLYDHIDQIETPFILFSAENESIVAPYAHQKFITAAKDAGKKCVAYEVEGAEHELLIEQDEQRTQTLNATLDFYKRYD
ncbi:alpha/beta fold hydrolase [Robertkochia sediminum]|uniref:alpha/beta fold hydrolase n=1 Tax=Robertkochia sediminum TaxID=2785326 RepID=UPI00193258D8|nr:alpha/beta fold hydrolase [Robertkochia sediminum]MBL7472580.1 alpha/beta fold hydrolase [Robertkochia sediminum]